MRPSVLFFLFIFLIPVFYCNGQQVEEVINKMPKSESVTADGIARYITAHFDDEEEIVSAIYLWIINNIGYDEEDNSEETPWGDEDIVNYTLREKRCMR